MSGDTFNKAWTWQHQLLPSVRTFVVRPDVWKMQARESRGREAWHFFLCGLKDTGVVLFHSGFVLMSLKQMVKLVFGPKKPKVLMRQQRCVNIDQLIGLLQGPLVLYYPQHSVDHGIRPFAHVPLRVPRGHMDRQLLSNGEEAVEYTFKTVHYTAKPATSLGLESMLCRASGYSAARYAVDSYRPGHAESMMGLLQGPGPYVHAQTSFTGAICAPICGFVAEHGLFQTTWSCQVRREKCCFIDWLRR